MYIYVYFYTFFYMSVNLYVYVRMCVCMSVCVYIYITQVRGQISGSKCGTRQRTRVFRRRKIPFRQGLGLAVEVGFRV